MKQLYGLAVAGLLAVSMPALGAQITGRVEILDKDGVKRKALREVLVYVEGLREAIPDSLRQRGYTVTSQNKSFTPRVEVVPVGTSVSFPNEDGIMHNVFSLSRGNRFDLGYYKGGASKTHRFDEPGLVRVYCNIHPQMSAFLLVMENPYFTWARSDGSFSIPAPPPGTYTVRAWQEQAQAAVQVTVGDQGQGGVELQLDTRRFKDKPHRNKFGRRYKKGERY
jgi:plastocyanin